MINDVLVHLFNEIWELEADAIITEEFKDISNNDMHIIEAIGLTGDRTMSQVAKLLNITAGSLTTSMNSLVNKQYAMRERSDKDRRVVFIRLTPKGIRAYNHHKEFHEQMTDAVIQSLKTEEIDVLIKTLDSLRTFFRQYQNPAEQNPKTRAAIGDSRSE
ncbi:MarR family winged helix-turn-helix transcriptional regulator [Hespellia stercorisuis]